jgi:hypothetical protein
VYKIDYTSKFYPDWWKKLPKTYVDESYGEYWPKPTMKTCVGFNLFHRYGISMPLWTDICIDIPNQNEVCWKFADRITESEWHNAKQWGDYIKEGYANIKIDAPWKFVCKEDINFVWVQNLWLTEDFSEVIIHPGILDYKTQHSTNINCFIPTDKTKNYIIPSGKPLTNIIPMSDRKVKIHNHLVDDKEYNQLAAKSTPLSFSNWNFKRKKLLDNEKKCPFGFK